jgi:hypothetical protein
MAYLQAAGDRVSVTPDTLPSFQAYRILHFGFTVAPIIFGIDKFFNLLVDWGKYLWPQIPQILHVTTGTFMRGVGVVEIVAGLLVGFYPRVGAYVVTAWLWAIIVNLLLVPGYYDIAVRDFGLSLGALALARLAQQFHFAQIPMAWHPEVGRREEYRRRAS